MHHYRRKELNLLEENLFRKAVLLKLRDVARLCSSDTLGRHNAQSLDVSEELTLDESVYRVEPARQAVEAHRSTFNYSGNPPLKNSCAQNRSAILLSVPVPVPAVVLVPAPAVLLAVVVPMPPGLLLPVAVLCISSVSDSEICMTTRVFTPAPTTFHGGSLARRDNEPPAMHKIDGKPKIDGNFFKSMAKSIKANRASLIVDEACTQHTGYYPSSSCENTPFQHWIEGDAMRMRIELKFRLIHQRMLAC
jgi:hypothetical protein